MSAVDELREAAAKMRALAEAVDGWWDGSEGMLSPLGAEDAAHLAAWSPEVALAVADWLDHAAKHAQARLDNGWDETYGELSPADSRATKVARAFLGRVEADIPKPAASFHELLAGAECACGAEHDRRGTGESGSSWFQRHLRDMEASA